MTHKLNDVIGFLHGENALEGVWFGDKHPGEPGAFWWRSRLREAIDQHNAQMPIALKGDQLVQFYYERGIMVGKCRRKSFIHTIRKWLSC